MTTALADQIIEIINHFANPEYSRCGGGGASYKDDGVMYIKPSGTSLADLQIEDLLPLRMDVLMDALHTSESEGSDPVRVAGAKARVGFDDGRRPSIETLIHVQLPQPLVIHLHPLTINALTCNVKAHQLAETIFGDQIVVVDYVDPGMALAREMEKARGAYTKRYGKTPPKLTLLRNHGIVAAGHTASEVIDLVEQATAMVSAAIKACPEIEPTPTTRFKRSQGDDEAEARRVTEMIQILAPHLRGLLGGHNGLAVVTSDTSELVRSETLIGKPTLCEGPLTPDQIVYAGSLPCVVEPQYAPLVEQVSEALETYRSVNGHDPTIVVLPSKVVFAIGLDHWAARNALDTFLDALRVARDANRLGKVRTLKQSDRDYIETWEAESYRRMVAATVPRGQMQSKVVVVTAAAQGFGLGIAQGLAAEGAHVVLADINLEQAKIEASKLVDIYGPGVAMAVKVDVADEASQQQAMAEILAAYGGVDLLVSNASLNRPASVVDQRLEDFDLVTAINYNGFFLSVRTVAPVMAAQHQECPDLLFDIIEINSTSGLMGSKHNFAYAGTKFGVIGMTQSFALELIESGIKVNAICPGEYLDGPRWSDPEKGLFTQYLRAGKVPGASSVANVRAFYESQIPMGRGCLPDDVVRAVLYLVAQQYETGQALPVTGGRVMMN